MNHFFLLENARDVKESARRRVVILPGGAYGFDCTGGTMKRQIFIPAALLAVGLAVGFAADRLLHAQPQAAIKYTSILKTALEGVAEKEAEVFVIEMAPGAATGRHSHPGTEMAYILEGAAAVEAGGNDVPITQRRGSLVYIAPNEVHEVKNQSKTETMKAVVFGLYDKGKPRSVPTK
jgi:quercetin dioxygenase-like cupin family protein